MGLENVFFESFSLFIEVITNSHDSNHSGLYGSYGTECMKLSVICQFSQLAGRLFTK